MLVISFEYLSWRPLKLKQNAFHLMQYMNYVHTVSTRKWF